jgi:hypothetical protein
VQPVPNANGAYGKPAKDMKDSTKFTTALIASAALVCLSVAYSILGDSALPDLEGRLQRKAYYERVISKKGLGLHKAMHWKESR